MKSIHFDKQQRLWVGLCMMACSFVCSNVNAQSGENLIINGGFEQGNAGFASDYGYSSGGNCCEGQYTVGQFGSNFNGFFTNPPPASPGSVQMMIVNGSTIPNQRIWYQTVGVVPGRTYALTLRGCTAVAGGPAVLQWQIDGALVGNSTSLPNFTQAWVDIRATWIAPPNTTSISLAVRNLNTATFPNDFYMDDLSMVEGTACDSLDFNNDTSLFDPQDIDAFLSVYSEGPCIPTTATCNDIDFNNDTSVFDPCDINSFLLMYSEGPCTPCGD
ncbi:MAG: hypothetical protein U0640_15845 [Phycisphaerales bacterium]